MGIGRLRNLAGPIGCQAVIDGETCHRTDNATVHRENFGPDGKNPKYHAYVPPTEDEKED